MTLFSVRSDYALRALTEIALWQTAGHSEPLPIEQIAVRQSIPRKFLEQILVTLKRAGLVRSRRGQAGGYLLEQDPGAIRLADVLSAVESLPTLAGQGEGDPPTPAAKAIRRSFEEIEAQLCRSLEEKTLADLLQSTRRERSRPMYHI